jgi:hypothetical protein
MLTLFKAVVTLTLKNCEYSIKDNLGECFLLSIPIRQAIMLVGGNKTGDKRWYEKNIPIAEKDLKSI